MFYIIQENVFREPNYGKLSDVLEELGLPYEIVQIQPFSDVLDFRTAATTVFVYGSVKLANIAQQYNWIPGSFYGGNHSFEVYSAHYGSHLLNHDSIVCRFGDELQWEYGEQKFIRPAKDAKVFTGKPFTQTKWNDFVEQTLTSKDPIPLNKDTLIQVTRPKKIRKEARVWIVGGKVITSSYYLFHGNSEFEEQVAADGLEFAQQMADHYQVAGAFVIDICLTLEGWKIVEINCINSAGFYKADITLLVKALEAHFHPVTINFRNTLTILILKNLSDC
jgi:hypothetical protein